MKKLILSVTAVAGCSLAGFAQGVITFDGSYNSNPSPLATSSGLVFIRGVLDTTADINAELLYGTSPNNVTTPVVTLLLSSSDSGTSPAIGQTLSAVGDIAFFGSGQFYDNSGWAYVIPNIAIGGTGYFKVIGWRGSDIDVTSVFSEVLTSPNAPYLANIDNMPALNLFSPEPSSLSMAVVGIGSMLIISGLRACLKIARGAAARDFGCGQGGEGGASL
jgi:hypothetical protein